MLPLVFVATVQNVMSAQLKEIGEHLLSDYNTKSVKLQGYEMKVATGVLDMQH